MNLHQLFVCLYDFLTFPFVPRLHCFIVGLSHISKPARFCFRKCWDSWYGRPQVSQRFRRSQWRSPANFSFQVPDIKLDWTGYRIYIGPSAQASSTKKYQTEKNWIKKKKISKKITSKSALYETALSFREEGTFEQGGGEQE
jgi:hypothetical protein